MKENKRENTFRRINETALACFSHEGYYNTSIRKIAKETGMAIGLLYSYYPTKEDLLVSLLREGKKTIEASFSVIDSSLSLHGHLLAGLKVLEDNASYWTIFQQARIHDSLFELMKPELSEMQHFIIEYYREILKDLKVKNSRTEARIIWSCLDSVFQQSRSDKEFNTGKFLRVLADKFG